MSELASPSAEPNYISRLALQSAPYNEAVDVNSFYSGKQIEQRLNLLLHLVQASNQIGFLVAAQGAGKSCLLTQLQARSDDGLRVCFIAGKSVVDAASLLSQCLRIFGVEDSEINMSNDVATLLKNRLIQLQKINIKPLLLIDDIDKLPNEIVREVTNWLLWQQDGTYLLQAIVSAKSEMTALDTLRERMQVVDLPVLSEAEVAAYLMQCLTSVGYQGELPFTAKETKRFYRQSLGNPAALNHLAHQKLLGIKPTLIQPVKINFSGMFRWAGLSILAISFISLLIFQDKVNELFESEQQSVDVIELPYLESDELATVVVDDTPVVSNEQAERDELLALVDEIPLSETSEVEAPVDTTEAVIVESVIDSADGIDNEGEAGVSEQSDDHQQDWILQQRATNYTFQLMGSWEHEELSEFIDKYALTGEVAEFESLRNGRVWYALIYGVYDSKQAALEASSAWPAPLNTLPSWLRRFDSVQKQIIKKVQAQ